MLNPNSLPGSQAAFSSRRVNLTPRIRRGRVVSFNTVTWRAVVQLDGAMSAVNMKVGDWVNPGAMALSAAAAVMLFNDSNPDDGLIVGPYNQVGGWDYFQRESVPAGESLTVPAGHQLVVYSSFEIAGSLTLAGRLVVEP